MPTHAIDVSQYQGVIDWPKVDRPIAIIRMSSGDGGLHYDKSAARNYKLAKAAGKAVGMYHYAGAGDPVAEADFFIKACSPLSQDDVMVLDWEVSHPDPVGWCVAFITRVIDKTGTKPLIYMNTSTENAYNWQPVIALDIALWLADYRYTPAQNAPVKHWKKYVMHQHSSKGSVPGIAGNVDLDEYFGTVASFKKYGYQAPVTQEPTPPVTPPVVPAPVEPTPTPPVDEPTNYDKQQDAKIDGLTALLTKVVDFLTSIFTGFKK
jgi:lysozyme